MLLPTFSEIIINHFRSHYGYLHEMPIVQFVTLAGAFHTRGVTIFKKNLNDFFVSLETAACKVPVLLKQPVDTNPKNSLLVTP